MAARKNPQLSFLSSQPKSYGGDLLRTRKGRSQGRPLDTRNSMHLVLRSTKAVGEWSFWRGENKVKVQRIVKKFAEKYAVKIHSMANVGNHLHFHIKLSNRFTYKPFIRAITAAIAMAVTGASRWNTLDSLLRDKIQGLENGKGDTSSGNSSSNEGFWDCRPFTRVVLGYRAFLGLRDYIEINQLEGFGYKRAQAKFFLKWNQLKLLEGTS